MRYSLIILILIGSLLSSCGREEVISDTPIRTGTQTILALGDSLTAGYGLPIEASYPSQLEARLTTLGYHYTIQNAGVS
jgi:acyl-CoA thioesterase-1